MYQTTLPVVGAEFRDREEQLARILRAVEKLRAGAPEWLALLGARKVGKTSLLLEASRQVGDHPTTRSHGGCGDPLPKRSPLSWCGPQWLQFASSASKSDWQPHPLRSLQLNHVTKADMQLGGFCETFANALSCRFSQAPVALD